MSWSKTDIFTLKQTRIAAKSTLFEPNVGTVNYFPDLVFSYNPHFPEKKYSATLNCQIGPYKGDNNNTVSESTSFQSQISATNIDKAKICGSEGCGFKSRCRQSIFCSKISVKVSLYDNIVAVTHYTRVSCNTCCLSRVNIWQM